MYRARDVLTNRGLVGHHPAAAGDLVDDECCEVVVGELHRENRLKAIHQTGSLHGGRSSHQWSNHGVPGVSRYASAPSTPKIASPFAVGSTDELRWVPDDCASAMSFAAPPQNRIARTIFFPTPRVTVASSAANRSELAPVFDHGLAEPAIARVECFVASERALAGGAKCVRHSASEVMRDRT